MTCRCACHNGGTASSIPCDEPGGCGHLHRDEESVGRLLARRRFIDGGQVDAADIARYLPELSALIADPGQKEADGSAHRKVSGSPAPWNVPVANLLLDIHTGARELADTLAVALGHNVLRYGTADAGTAQALAHTATLARALHDRDAARHLPEHATTQLRSWAAQARKLLDQSLPHEQPWTRAPEPLRCPNEQDDGSICDRPLWLAPGWIHQTDPPVYCRHCRDEDGGHYSWPHAAWALTVQQSA